MSRRTVVALIAAQGTANDRSAGDPTDHDQREDLYDRMVEQRYAVALDGDPDRVFDIVSDHTRYVDWLDIVHRVEPAPSSIATSDDAAHFVTLRAKIGPLARSKRLRMIRTVNEPQTRVRFERAELDGRDHSQWTLDCAVDPDPTGGTALAMSLAYGGRQWSSVLEGLLDAQVDRATAKLQALTAS